jgi:hypothetical protein
MAIVIKPPSAPAADRPEPSPIVRRTPMPSNGDFAGAGAANRPVGFVKSTGRMKSRMVVSLTGEDHSGKNHCAFTAPAPLYVHSFDPGIEGVVEKFNGSHPEFAAIYGSKDIYVATYELAIQPGDAAPQVVAESADQLWQQFIANYRDGMASCGNGTTIVDTDTEAYELIRLARFGKLTQIMPHHYGPINAEFRAFLRESQGMPGNVFMLSKYVDEWENFVDASGKEKGRKTGGKVRKGFGELPFLMQVCGISERIDQLGGGSQFQITITDCRQRPECNGTAVQNDYDMLRLVVLGE